MSISEGHSAAAKSLDPTQVTHIPPPQCWLVVESFDNWLADKKNNFAFLGIASYRLAAAKKIKKGDLIIAYLPGPRFSFADVRLVISEGLSPLKHGGDYDIACPACVRTTPLVVLPEEKRVPIGPLKESLKFIFNKTYWGFAMRRSLRPLEATDSGLILRAMRAAYPEGDWKPITDRFGNV